MTKRLIKIQILQLPISQLLLNPNNPRVITDEKQEQLAKSLTEFPEMMDIREIVIDEDNLILGGNMRFKAAQKLGLQMVTVKRVTGLTPKQKREFIIKDNANLGSWDWAELSTNWIIQEIEDWGVDFPDIKVNDQAQDDNFQVDEQVQTDIKPGDLITIGAHRLLCGNARSRHDVDRLMESHRADLAHNDPPYGMKKEAAGIANDNLNAEDLLAFNADWITLQLSVLKPNASWYCWGMDEPLFDIYANVIRPLQRAGTITFRQLITWDKSFGQGQMLDSHRQYATADEKCLFFMMGKQVLNRDNTDFPEGWRPILDYLRAERLKMEWTTQRVIEITGKQTASHYFSESQFMVPTAEHYAKLQQAADGQAFIRSWKDLQQEFERYQEAFNSARAYFDNTHDNMNSVWHFSKATPTERVSDHATPKPIQLCARVISTSCQDNGLLVDFFVGTGSSMVAAHQLGRTCFAMDIEPKWCQVTVDRMRKLAPDIAITINGKPA